MKKTLKVYGVEFDHDGNVHNIEFFSKIERPNQDFSTYQRFNVAISKQLGYSVRAENSEGRAMGVDLEVLEELSDNVTMIKGVFEEAIDKFQGARE